MPRTPDNDGSTSICTQPGFHPIAYHWYPHTPGEKFATVLRTVAAAIEMPQHDRERLVGEMAARMVKLRQGNLVPKRHIIGPAESVTGIELFEVRAGVDFGTASTAQMRAYHAEPRTLQSTSSGSTVIGLHVHHKVTEGTDEEIRARQDAEMQEARTRYFHGRRSWWGGCAVPNR